MSGRSVIVPIDQQYAVSFPNEDNFIEEHEDGSMSILVDIYKIVEGKTTKMDKEGITPEVHAKVEAFVNEMLNQAIEFEKYEKRLKK